MKASNASNHGSVALGYIGASLLLLIVIGGWYATWHHYRYGGPVPACSPSNLHLSIGATDGTAGTQYTHVVLFNQGNSSCTLTGYPTAFLTDVSNNPIGGIAPSGSTAPQTTTLKPGKPAHVIVSFPDHGAFATPQVCTNASTNFQLYLPNSVASLSVPFVQYDCPGTTVGAFQSGQ